MMKPEQFLLALAFPLWACSQSGVNSPGVYQGKEFSAGDCFNKTRYKKLAFADSVRGNDILQGQRYWRVISLDDQQNKSLFNTNRGCTQVGLFEVMKFGLFDQKLNAFESDDFDQAAKFHLTPAQLLARLQFRDSSEVQIFDAEGKETKETKITNRFYLGSDVKSYLLKEDWLINSKSGETEVRIIAIAPLVENPLTGGLQPLFWLYYPEWRELLSCFMTQSAFDDEPSPYSSIFAKRKFISQVSKESNLYDRSVRSIHHGEDIRLRTDQIREKNSNRESDHFGN
jgi:hypothetical protein